VGVGSPGFNTITEGPFVTIKIKIDRPIIKANDLIHRSAISGVSLSYTLLFVDAGVRHQQSDNNI
jgi:hypothetical protein